MMAEVFETHDLEIYRPQRPLPSLRILPLLFTVLKGLWRTRSLLFGIVAALFRRNTLSARYRTEVESFEQAMAEQPDFALPIDAFLRHYYAKMSAVARNATAPALIVVGALMMRGARELDWSQIDEAVPAFLTVATMPFTYSIANGISIGIVSYVLIKALRGRFRDVHPVMYVLAGLLILFYAVRTGG